MLPIKEIKELLESKSVVLATATLSGTIAAIFGTLIYAFPEIAARQFGSHMPEAYGAFYALAGISIGSSIFLGLMRWERLREEARAKAAAYESPLLTTAQFKRILTSSPLEQWVLLRFGDKRRVKLLLNMTTRTMEDAGLLIRKQWDVPDGQLCEYELPEEIFQYVCKMRLAIQTTAYNPGEKK